eukprot:scaffold31968_cov101-Isochrysis_galbana.AAC.2
MGVGWWRLSTTDWRAAMETGSDGPRGWTPPGRANIYRSGDGAINGVGRRDGVGWERHTPPSPPSTTTPTSPAPTAAKLHDPDVGAAARWGAAGGTGRASPAWAPPRGAARLSLSLSLSHH